MWYLENLKKGQEKSRAERVLRDKNTIGVIKSMVEANEQVTVKELVKRTGLSVSYFSVNEVVREAVLEAQEFQNRKRMPVPEEDKENPTLDQQLISLARQNEGLRMEVAILRRENRDLKEQLREQAEQLEEPLSQQI